MVGGAVTRNLVKRRLRQIAREVLSVEPSGYRLIVRAQTGAAGVDWNRLREEFLNTAKLAFKKVER
jgi:ribonuclease P protein component